MIKFYYHPSPNPAKVALFLEEAGLEYELVPVDTRKGEQHSSGYRSINPNAKTPSIVDGEATVFDSSAILLYLAEKTKRFLPENTPKARGELLSWLFFVSSGVGPYSGQAFHFNVAARRRSNTRSIDTISKRTGIGRSSTTGWPDGDTSSATPIRSWTCRFRVCELRGPTPLGRGDLVKDGQCEASRRRDQRASGRGSR